MEKAQLGNGHNEVDVLYRLPSGPNSLAGGEDIAHLLLNKFGRKFPRHLRIFWEFIVVSPESHRKGCHFAKRLGHDSTRCEVFIPPSEIFRRLPNVLCLNVDASRGVYRCRFSGFDILYR